MNEILDRYRYELLTLKPSMCSQWKEVTWGGPRITGLHIPPNNFVCCIPNAVSQTKWSVDPRGIKQHNTNILEWMRWMKTHFTASRAVSQLNVYHFSQQNENNDDNDKNNENNGNNRI